MNWKAVGFLALGFIAAIASVVLTAVVMPLWPRRLMFVVFPFYILGTVLIPMFLCTIYPLRLLIEKRASGHGILMAAAFILGLLSIFAGATVATGVIASRTNHAASQHMR